jgi:hypothetical protein
VAEKDQARFLATQCEKENKEERTVNNVCRQPGNFLYCREKCICGKGGTHPGPSEPQPNLFVALKRKDNKACSDGISRRRLKRREWRLGKTSDPRSRQTKNKRNRKKKKF